MYVTAIKVRGFADLPHYESGLLERVVHFKGPSLETTALGDAIQLAFAALSHAALRDLLHRWELCAPDEEPEILGDDFPDQATWSDGDAARVLVGPERHLKVELSFNLDPPLFGQLRQHAARAPRLAAALSSGAELHLAVGALFTSTYDGLAVAVHSIRIGDVTLTEADRTRWANKLLRDFGLRLARHRPDHDAAPQALDALTSRDGLDAYLDWTRALGPEGPKLRALRGPGGRAQIYGGERPIARWGPDLRRQAALAASIHLSGADILWVDQADPTLVDAVEGPASPLEQVFMVSEAGTLAIDNEPAPPPATTPLPTSLRPTDPS